MRSFQEPREGIFWHLTCRYDSKPPYTQPPQPKLGPLAIYDAAIRSVNEDRGKTYGHPSENFARIAALTAALPRYHDVRFDHIATMICVKLARLAQDPTHLDALIDIAGYARTWVMILDKEQPK